MFKTTKELKQFILWCKSEKIKSAKIADIEFEISEIAFVEELNSQIPIENDKQDSIYNKETLVDTVSQNQAEEDEDLFWSANS